MSAESSSKPLPEPGITLLDVAKNNSHQQATTSSTVPSFEELYKTDQHIRSGSYGAVYTCHHRSYSDTTYAVKILERAKLKPKDDAAVFREVSILQQLSQIPSVVRLIDFFQTPSHLHLVQIYAAGGDVFDRLTQRTVYTEMDACVLAKTLLQAILQFHQHQPFPVVHRDLKPENLLLLDPVDDSTILIADFGFARHVRPDEYCTTRCGTPAYVAPEVIIGVPYSTKCDLWSIGCILYMLIGGYPPFKGSNHRELFRKVRAGDFVFHESHWKKVSIEAKRLISNLLCVNPAVRFSAQEALQADWFTKSDADSLRSTDLSGSLRELEKNFRPKLTWKSTVKALRFAATAPFWNADATSFTKQLKHWDDGAVEHGYEDSESMMSSTAAVTEAMSATPTIDNKKTSSIEGVMQQLTTSTNTTTLLGALPNRITFADTYELRDKVRKGSFATVWRCAHRKTQEVYAVKIIKREGLDPKDDEAVLNEVSIMQCLHHNKYVVRIIDFFEESDYFYLIMEHMAGGDVFDRIVQMTHYTEKDARDLVLTLLKAVHSLHKAGIAHRDIKPQNLLLESPDNHAAIKLADFGFSRRVHTPESLTSRVGTPSYVAPEILKNVPHDERVDIWSIGVVTFVLLVGYPPFVEENQSALFRKIRNGDWEFDEHAWREISPDAKDLIQGCLKTNPKERWSIEDCMRCSWIGEDPRRLSTTSLTDSLKTMKQKQARLRSVAKAITWFMGKDTKPTEDVATLAQSLMSEASSKPPEDVTIAAPPSMSEPSNELV